MLIIDHTHRHRWVNIYRANGQRQRSEGFVCRKCGRRVTRSWALDELPSGGCAVASEREVARLEVGSRGEL